MKCFSLILLACMAVSCDCYQNVEGTVTNEKGIPLKGVTVYKTSKDFITAETDSVGHFELTNTSGGLGGCPPMTVTAKKNGYVTTEVTIPNAGSETIILKTE